MRSARSIIHLLKSFFAGLLTPGRKPLDPVEHVDIPRYMGSWRVIAIYDNPVERHFADAVESYRHRGDGDIAVEFRWREDEIGGRFHIHRFTARVTDRPANARWRVRLLPIFSAAYVIIALDEKYRWAAVAHPSRKFGWILARHTEIPESIWKDLLDVFRHQGYDPAKFHKVPQPPGLTPPPSSLHKSPA
jgi:apolipoprotein D and lipocalin family protein